MSDVMEIARFKALNGADAVRFAAGMDPWLAAQPGFVSRALVGPDEEGFFTDLVRWRSMADAEAAVAAMDQSEEVGAFMAVIVPGTVQMSHLSVAHG